MRILAYTQLLESYRSLTLQYMAEAFGVTVEYIDQWVLSIFLKSNIFKINIFKTKSLVTNLIKSNKILIWVSLVVNKLYIHERWNTTCKQLFQFVLDFTNYHIKEDSHKSRIETHEFTFYF